MTEDNDRTKPDFQPVIIDLSNPDSVAKAAEEHPDMELDESAPSMTLARMIMEEFRPGIVIITSPIMMETENGYLCPTDVGVSLNNHVGITRSLAAAILREVADSLDEDINKVMNFVNEATGKDEDE